MPAPLLQAPPGFSDLATALNFSVIDSMLFGINYDLIAIYLFTNVE